MDCTSCAAASATNLDVARPSRKRPGRSTAMLSARCSGWFFSTPRHSYFFASVIVGIVAAVGAMVANGDVFWSLDMDLSKEKSHRNSRLKWMMHSTPTGTRGYGIARFPNR